MSPAHCYAIRLLNPYTGVLQVVEHGIARSLSRNGFNWEIQVQVERKTRGWGSLNRHKTELKYYRYAFWNPRDGLTPMPTDPGVDIDLLRQGYKGMLQQLRSGLLEQLPFPFEDRHELWLLDKKQQPLALLGSTCDNNMIPKIRELHWHAVSSSLNIEACPQAKAERLESQIRRHSGTRQWFLRKPGGEGVGLDYRTSAKLVGRELLADAFPELLLQEEWDNPQAKLGIDEWAECMAPWLLQLRGISDERRGQLEQAASKNPQMVDVLYRLYPRIIDQQLINSTRVAAKIKTASQ